MNEFGSEGPPEIDPDIAQIQANQLGNAAAVQAVVLPTTGFVASLNGQSRDITLQAGSIPAGISVSFTNGVGTVSFNLSGLDASATRKNNLVAIIDPAVGNDSSQGYAVGSFWLNTITPSFWVAASVAVGAAVWLKLSP